MRLDKFLKVSRVIKRRTVAKEICEAGKILVNDLPAKAGKELKVGDTVTVSMGSRRLKIRVAELRETVRAAEADTLYEVLEDRRVKEEEIQL
ncbi:MAG: RNA-binding S4 domain-containing protein [Bacillota bacterium]|jgi:ribosomal 50S subunit-recycling heat shock protein